MARRKQDQEEEKRERISEFRNSNEEMAQGKWKKIKGREKESENFDISLRKTM